MEQQPTRAPAGATLALNVPSLSTASDPRSLRSSVLCEGWMLKKRRKKLQGYAKRYFTLDQNGILAYSFEPGSFIRDQISIPSAAISSSQGRRDVHVDSGRVTFHIKCLNEDDFDKWMDALRKFTPTGSEMERVMSRRSLSRGMSLRSQTGKLHQATVFLDEMGRTIEEISTLLYHDNVEEEANATTINKLQTTSLITKYKEDKGHPLLSLFKKPMQPPSGSSYSTIPPRDDVPNRTMVSHLPEQLAPLIARLRSQHDILSDLLQRVPTAHLHHKTPLQEAINEESATAPMEKNRSSWKSIRSSMSTVTDKDSMFFDAMDEEFGAEEYVVQEDQEELSIIKDEPSTTTTSTSVTGHEDKEYASTHVEDQTPEEKPSLSVNRRTGLPARPPADEGSLFAILKKNVGQDLSNIAFPVTFNEPLTLLQRAAEELEYYHLLDTAASTTDWIERICYVAAFAVSGYACTKFRGSRKGFTPLLCETFEEARLNFIAEKVVHKPLIIAYHADGPGWELNATSAGKTKFWGKSFEVIPTGFVRLRIGTDEFEWNKPSSFTRNLMMGTKYLEHCGEMVVKNTTSGAQCVLDFKETGYWASTPNVVAGTVYSPDGKTVSKLEGKWDEQIAQKLDSQHLKILWRVTPFPRDAATYYGYSCFAITLNEITPDIQNKLAPTDSRLRPDVRALEEGDVERAEHEKTRLEQMQRERRQKGLDPKPRWFRHVDDSDEWIYVGGYWEARRTGWKNMEIKPLW